MTALLQERQITIPTLQKPCALCVGWGTLEAFDGFAGAGGSSLGLEAVCCPACGRQLIRVVGALNHDYLAVEAHNENFPHALHDVHDIQDVHPSRFPWTPLAWFSPDCGHHAYCRGKRSTDDAGIRARMTFFDIVRFAEYHRYHAVIVENVIEARLWCDTPGHPEKCNCGSHFDSWYASMEQLGYDGHIVFFNSQFALPTPQSRDRMYVVWWRRGLPAPNLDFRPISWCSTCSTVVRGIQTWKRPSRGSVRIQPGKFRYGRYGTQYIYVCPDCCQQVAPAVTGAKTIIDPSIPTERIGDKNPPLKPNTRVRIVYGANRVGAYEPLQVQVGGHLYERRPGVRVWSMAGPLRTVHCTSEMALVVRYGGQAPAPRALGEPLATLTAHDRQLGLITPAGGQDAHARSIEEPMHTVIANDRLAVFVPNMEHNAGASAGEPVGAVTSGNRHMLVQVNRGDKGKPTGRALTLHEPTRTIAGHGELALVELRGNPNRPGGGNQAKTVDEPAGTLAAHGNHHGLLVYNGNPGFVQPLEMAAGTVTARDKQSLLIPYYSTGVGRPTSEPMGTVTTKDREALVFTDGDIDDWHFRMLQWTELLRAQQMHVHGNGDAYRLEARKKDKRGRIGQLSNEDKVRMIGMAVSSPVATLLGTALVLDTLAVSS